MCGGGCARMRACVCVRVRACEGVCVCARSEMLGLSN